MEITRRGLIRVCLIGLLTWIGVTTALGQAPQITKQPEGGFVLPGATVALRANVTGDAPIQFQWYRDGIKIPHGTAPILLVTNAGVWFYSLPNRYYLDVSNLYGSNRTTEVVLQDSVVWEKKFGGNGHRYSVVTVDGNLSWARASGIAEDFGGYLACVGGSGENEFIFKIINNLRYWPAGSGPWLGGFQQSGSIEPLGGWRWVSGEPFYFQSWESGEPNNGAGLQDRLSFYSVKGRPDLTWDDNVNGGNVNSAVIEWPERLMLFRYKSDFYEKLGSDIDVSVLAIGPRKINYQWYRLDQLVQGGTNKNFKIKNISTEDDLVFFCRISDGLDVIDTEKIRFRFLPEVSVGQDRIQFEIEGASKSVVLNSTGRSPFYYQWFRNQSPIRLETNQNLELSGLKVGDAANYWVEVSNQDGSTNSPATFVKVLPPAFTLAFQDDFEKIGPRLEVPNRPIKRAQGLRPFSYLGDFSNQRATVALTNLPAHTHIHLQADVLMLRSVDGSSGTGQGDVFRVESAGGELLYETTFSNFAWSRAQTYPGRVGDPLLNARAGAVEQNTLGVVNPIGTGGQRPQDALYRLTFDFAHTGPELKLTFSGRGWSPVADEAWGLDNLVIATASLVEGNPPVLTRVPEPQVVRVGDAAAFQVSAASAGAVQYQWSLDGVPIPDATNSWYAIPAVYPGWYLPEVPGDYSVRVSNAYGSVSPPPVPLIVVTQFPESITGVEGKDLELVGKTTRPVQYQWMRDGRVLVGETNSTLRLSNPTAADAGRYGLIFSLGGSAVTGGASTLQVRFGWISTNRVSRVNRCGTIGALRSRSTTSEAM